MMTFRYPVFLFALETLALLMVGGQCSTAVAQGTAFTYQGQLQNAGLPANGVYNLTFALFASPSGGSPLAGTVTNSGVNVTNGLFTAAIDFGYGAFNGSTNWLEIGVAPGGQATFTTLSPRQLLTPVPNAIFAENVNAAGLAGLNVLTNGATGVNLGSFTATNYGYVARWVTNSCAISTNDTLLFCWGTNEVLTLPSVAPLGKMFSIFSKNPGGSVILTNSTGSQVITVPGLGQRLAVYLGASTSPSNILTVTFDGSNY